MSFYLKPPRGETNLHVLLECTQQRKNCYENLKNNFDIRTIENLEYLTEDSILDRTSHYIFRLGVLTGAISKIIFIDNELKIFKKRTECYQKDDFVYFLRKILRQLKDCIRMNIGKKLSDFYWSLYKIICEMLRKEYLHHVFNNTCKDSTSCDSQFRVQVPFWYCNKLISSREVDLKNGDALFQCDQWHEILPNLFNSYLEIILTGMRHSENVKNALADDRITACLQIIKNEYSTINTSPSKNSLHLSDLEGEIIKFPMCMRNLYDELKKNHRLQHYDRFDLSVFLRGIGLSLNDSMKFWQEEYSQEHSTCSKCTHSWQENERKYIYGLRHLYGLEGSRRTYSVKPCSNLQGDSIGLNCKGGCPFTHYDDEFLRKVLQKNLPGFEDDIEIMIFERKENATWSCQLFSKCTMKLLKGNNMDQMIKFENPLQFYKNIRRTLGQL